MPQFLLSIDLDVTRDGPDADAVTAKVVGDVVAHEVAKALRLVEVRRSTPVVIASALRGAPSKAPPAAVLRVREVAVLRAVEGSLPPSDPAAEDAAPPADEPAAAPLEAVPTLRLVP